MTRSLTLVLVVTALSAGCSPPPPARNVLFILMDTVRGDRLSAQGYERETTPHLDELAATGAIFLRHYSQGSNTRAAMPSLTYSRYFMKPLFPASARVPLSSPTEIFQQLDEGAVALPQVLAAAGRRTVLINTHPWLQPQTEFARLFESVDHVYRRPDPKTARRIDQAGADQIVDRALEWLSENGDEPFFMHLHLMDAHGPLIYTEDAEAMLPEGAPRSPERWMFDDRVIDGNGPAPDQVAWMNASYDGALRFADRELGRLFDHLRGSALMAQTLIVVTSDHGEALYEHGQLQGHGGPMREPVAHVPLILHYPPRIAPVRVQDLSESVDIMPTVLQLTDVLLPPGSWADGIDLFDTRARRRRHHALGRTFVRSERYKLLLSSPVGAVLRDTAGGRLLGELYDLESDPGETTDLWDHEPEVVGELLRAYRDRLGEPFRVFRAARADVQPDAVFAISVRHLALTPAGDSSGSLAASGWQRSSTWNQSWLRGTDGALPIEAELRIPNGRYRLSLHGWGHLNVEVAVDETCSEPESQGLRFDQAAGTAKLHALGEIEVCSALLRLRLEPRGKVKLSHFAFHPLDSGPAELDHEERDALLEALGYVN